MFSQAACISFEGDVDFCVTYSAVSYLSFNLVICNCDTERILQLGIKFTGCRSHGYT